MLFGVSAGVWPSSLRRDGGVRLAALPRRPAPDVRRAGGAAAARAVQAGS
jgi:hypothetical protein